MSLGFNKLSLNVINFQAEGNLHRDSIHIQRGYQATGRGNGAGAHGDRHLVQKPQTKTQKGGQSLERTQHTLTVQGFFPSRATPQSSVDTNL